MGVPKVSMFASDFVYQMYDSLKERLEDVEKLFRVSRILVFVKGQDTNYGSFIVDVKSSSRQHPGDSFAVQICSTAVQGH